MTLDFSTDHGKMAKEQLEKEIVIWFTTVTPKGMPQPNPVWFIWEDDCVIIWVQANSARLRNLPQNPQVSLHFATDPHASHMTVLTGEAEIDESLGRLDQNETHLAKYTDLWRALGMTPEAAANEYSVPLRIRPSKLRGF